jgi:hypothetical protein
MLALVWYYQDSIAIICRLFSSVAIHHSSVIGLSPTDGWDDGYFIAGGDGARVEVNVL